jgi:hypothetical protein
MAARCGPKIPVAARQGRKGLWQTDRGLNQEIGREQRAVWL